MDSLTAGGVEVNPRARAVQRELLEAGLGQGVGLGRDPLVVGHPALRQHPDEPRRHHDAQHRQDHEHHEQGDAPLIAGDPPSSRAVIHQSSRFWKKMAVVRLTTLGPGAPNGVARLAPARCNSMPRVVDSGEGAAACEVSELTR